MGALSAVKLKRSVQLKYGYFVTEEYFKDKFFNTAAS